MGLWFLGDLPDAPQADHHLSIVGARASTGAGNRCARNMAAFVATAGVTVVSGGAIGIDIEAHRGALSARGRTICILAGGVCNPYPACHGGDFRAVIDGGGALISEVAPTARPAKWRFLTRNRLIAAWSGATVVVEAGARSGALATARRAMEYGRELGAVPGAVDAPMSVGCLELARNGATIIRDGRDALELVRPVSVDAAQPLFGMPVDDDHGVDALEPTQRRVWEALPRSAPASVEAICVAAALSREEVNYALMELSVAGLVAGTTRGWTRTGGGRP
jgi:DNA protecting protein dprA